jgi:hypothetical protein
MRQLFEHGDFQFGPVPGERLQIRYEDTAVPGYFFRAPDAEPGEPRPLVVLNNGSDGATSHMGLFGGWAALERGYHAMTFDGPGQPAHDWEAVLTPVVDAMAARPTSTRPDRPGRGHPGRLLGPASPRLGASLRRRRRRSRVGDPPLPRRALRRPGGSRSTSTRQ